MLQLKSISLLGFMGISSDVNHRLALNDLAQRNVFVGPNNSGKSLVQRFMHLLKGEELLDGEMTRRLGQQSVKPHFFWNCADRGKVEATIEFHSSDETRVLDGTKFMVVANHTLRLQVSMIRQGGEAEVDSFLMLHHNGEWHVGTKIIGSQRKFLESGGGYGDSPPAWHGAYKGVVLQLSAKMYFFDAVRALDRGNNRRGVDDGSKLLEDLYSLSRKEVDAGEWSRFHGVLVDKLNSILPPCGIPRVHRIELKEGLSSQASLLLHFESDPMVGINIQAMGSGISQLIMILAAIVRCRDEPKIFFIEEPETNLHPALLRSFISALRSYDQHQFFITTHSSVVIDAFAKPDKIFRFELDPKTSSCRAKECRELIDLHSVLDDLGVSGSMVLQANCVVWVEGPSDRLYLRKWLADRHPSLQEGRDHVFIFYGGSALAHLSFDAEDLSDQNLSSLIRVSRFSAVLIDQDDIDQLGGPLPPVKERFFDEAAADPKHRLACRTEGREIENDLPGEVLIKAAASILRLDLTGCIVGPADDYAEIISERARDLGQDKAIAKKRLNKKLVLAQRVLEFWETGKQEIAVPSYVDTIAAFIHSSRTAV